MRNLHREGLRYNTPWFISLLESLDIKVSPEQSKMALRRFLLGEKLYRMKFPIRHEVTRTIQIPTAFELNNIEDFFNEAKTSLKKALKLKNIKLCKVINIDFSDQETMIDVTFLSIETDKELNIRQSYAETFNKILSKKDKIYFLIDKHLIKSKNL